MVRFLFFVFVIYSNIISSQDIVDIISVKNSFYILYSDSTWSKISGIEKLNLERSEKYINRYSLTCLNNKLVDRSAAILLLVLGIGILLNQVMS